MAAATGTDVAGYVSEGPGVSAFALADGAVYHTYSTYARGMEFLMGYYPILDRAPKGRVFVKRHIMAHSSGSPTVPPHEQSRPWRSLPT
jgi:predicted dithiol-disulfide oxidoreductase (DUF899 family)